jgi:hypothetical protein
MAAGVSPSPFGFVVVRGRRGYRPDQVEDHAAGLFRETEAARAEIARLTALEQELTAEAARLAETVAALAPQTYESLGERARGLLSLVEEEAAEVRLVASADADVRTRVAHEAATALRDGTRAAADALRAGAEESADAREAAARTEADETRAAARQDAADVRDGALAAFDATRQRAETLLADQSEDQSARLDSLERDLTAAADAATARENADEAAAESRLAEARQTFADAQDAARRTQEDAESTAADALAGARARADGIAEDAARVVAGHEETRTEMRARMEHVRASLATLTGRPVGEAEAEPGA